MGDRDGPFGPDGVPLGDYLQHKGAVVRLSCRRCRGYRDFPVQTVIDGLKARGEGGAGTGIIAVARLTRKACPKCGERDFISGPAFPASDAPRSS